jgi:hypothetical protein
MAHRKPYVIQGRVGQSLPAVVAGDGWEHLCVAAALYPCLACARKTFIQVDAYIGVCVRAGCIIYRNVGVGILCALAILYFDSGILVHAAHSHPDVGEEAAAHVYFL